MEQISCSLKSLVSFEIVVSCSLSLFFSLEERLFSHSQSASEPEFWVPKGGNFIFEFQIEFTNHTNKLVPTGQHLPFSPFAKFEI